MLRQIIPITGLLLSTFLLLAGVGLTSVVLPLRAQLEGWSTSTIGWLGACFAAFFMLGCLLVPRMVLRVGHVRTYAVLAAMLCISVLLHSLFINIPLWMLARGLGGFALAGTYMVIESWLNEQASNETRGKIFSVYMLVNLSGLVAGQFLLVTGDPATTVLFVLAGLLYATAVIPTGLTNAVSPRPLSQNKLDIKKLFANSPVAMFGALGIGFVYGGWNFQSAIYARDAGLTDTGIATMLAITMAGGACFQFPLGWISDRTDRRYVILAAVAGCVVVAGLLYLLAPEGGPLLFGLMFVFGGFFMPIYSLVVAYGNDHADPSEFVEISSGLLVVYGIGSMIGPVVAGWMMDVFGRNGLFLSVLCALLPLIVFIIIRITIRDAVPEEDRIDYNFAPPGTGLVTPERFNLDPRSDESEYSSYEEPEEDGDEQETATAA
ncbi:MAG: MFS transporter [Ahrensia sp.]